jgi:phosphopantothenoylcysteine decarboxylase / phosphopantothenate---cysteine ligase
MAHPFPANPLMASPLRGKNILLGVTGSIAAYKAAELASRLAQSGAEVEVILTQSACQFVQPLTFQSVTGRRAFLDADLWGSEGHVQHIGLATNAHLLVIAPASANTLAKMACGIADNLLTLAALAARCPILLAPAMDGGMFSHPATQANLETLRQRGATIIGPAQGHLASGLTGLGRMVEPEEIFAHTVLVLAKNGPLAGKKIVVSAGGTQEPIDPVRVIMNRSSGKQGLAIAQAALERGARVVLVSGPIHLPVPIGVNHLPVRTAEEMLAAVLHEVVDADALVMAAAVADFRPISAAGDKIKREKGVPQITLEPTPDILTAVAELKNRSGMPRVVVGFAAESQDLIQNARNKLHSKQLDLIVANDITALDAGFAVDTNRVTILDAGGGQEALPLLSKAEVAAVLIERIIGLLP